MTSQYQLGLACLELAQGYASGDNLRRIALAELEALRDETKETVHLVVLDQMQVVYMEKIPGLHAIGLMSSGVGRQRAGLLHRGRQGAAGLPEGRPDPRLTITKTWAARFTSYNGHGSRMT